MTSSWYELGLSEQPGSLWEGSSRRDYRISRALIVSYLSILGGGGGRGGRTQESHGTEKATQANPDTSAFTGNALDNLTTITEEKELFSSCQVITEISGSELVLGRWRNTARRTRASEHKTHTLVQNLYLTFKRRRWLKGKKKCQFGSSVWLKLGCNTFTWLHHAYNPCTQRKKNQNNKNKNQVE